MIPSLPPLRPEPVRRVLIKLLLQNIDYQSLRFILYPDYSDRVVASPTKRNSLVELSLRRFDRPLADLILRALALTA